jgi:hypothetical protein
MKPAPEHAVAACRRGLHQCDIRHIVLASPAAGWDMATEAIGSQALRGGKFMSRQQFENEIMRQEISDQFKPVELSDRELDAVAGGKASGGKLFEATCKGTHIRDVRI